MTVATILSNRTIFLLAAVVVLVGAAQSLAISRNSWQPTGGGEVSARQTAASRSTSPAGLRPSSEPSYAQQARELLGFGRPLGAVDFDARTANRDQDVDCPETFK